MSEFEFKCNFCEEIHTGIPTFGTNFPITVAQIPEEERESRVKLGSDDCVIDEEQFYIRGCVEILVHGYDDPFVLDSWVSLSRENYLIWVEYFEKEKRSHIGPFFGWFCNDFIQYEQSYVNLKTQVHIRDNGIRPYIELEPSDHSLALEQRQGISKARLIEIYESVMHGK